MEESTHKHPLELSITSSEDSSDTKQHLNPSSGGPAPAKLTRTHAATARKKTMNLVPDPPPTTPNLSPTLSLSSTPLNISSAAVEINSCFMLPNVVGTSSRQLVRSPSPRPISIDEETERDPNQVGGQPARHKARNTSSRPTSTEVETERDLNEVGGQPTRHKARTSPRPTSTEVETERDLNEVLPAYLTSDEDLVIKSKEAAESSMETQRKVMSALANLDLTKIKISEDETEFRNRYKDEIVVDFGKWNARRDKIAYEFLTTENNYVKNLELSILIYRSLITQHYDISKIQPLMSLFDQISVIWEVNSTLLDGLKKKFQDWSDQQTIGDVISTFAPFLKMYQSYAQVYDEGITCVKKISAKDKVFVSILEKGVSHPLIKGNSIDSFLILPVQRVPRYVLLLTDLIKSTSEDHPDTFMLKEALGKLRIVAGNINDAVKLAESRAKCLELTKQFILKDVTFNAEAHRLFIYQGTVTKQCRNKREDRELFLFSDVLLYAHILPNNKYEVVGDMPLETTVVSELKNVGELKDIPEQDILNGFVLHAPVKSFYCYASSAAEKSKWMKFLEETITHQKNLVEARNKVTSAHTTHTNNPNNPKAVSPQKPVGTAAVWIPDNLSNSCSICGKEFSAFHRRHHCRKCGAVVDSECSKNTILVPETNKLTPVRVCNTCFSNYNKK